MDKPLNRDQARARRAYSLRAAYRRTGDRRKLKRAKRLERYLYDVQIRRFNRDMATLSDALRAHDATLRRFVDSITKAFAQIGAITPKGPQL